MRKYIGNKDISYGRIEGDLLSFVKLQYAQAMTGGVTMHGKILVVDDEQPIADIYEVQLGKRRLRGYLRFRWRISCWLAFAEQPDLMLLDLMLPVKDGMDVCREVRARLHMPIIMLTAKDTEIDKVLGLELGADDYVTKPFSTRELLAPSEGPFAAAEGRVGIGQAKR